MSLPLYIANWKMYKTLEETRDYFSAFLPLLSDGALEEKAHIWMAVPHTSLPLAHLHVKGRGVSIGAQDIAGSLEGAYTGEVSAPMVRDAGGAFTLIGHSERRRLFGESEKSIQEKIACALLCGIIPVVCVGESYEERASGKIREVLEEQILSIKLGIEKKEELAREIKSSTLSNKQPISSLEEVSIVLAYEPVWAIGTGEAASVDEIKEAVSICHNLLEKGISSLAKSTPILYGGSVNDTNIGAILGIEGVGGVLVGGVSLSPQSFIKILDH